MPAKFGAWSTVHHCFRQWRDAGVLEALLECLIAEAAKRGGADLALVSIDSTTARAHHDAAAMHLGQDVITVLEKAASEEEKARPRGAASKNKAGRTAKTIPREERRRIRRRRKRRLKAALLGRSRGGLTSKLPLAVDRKCRPLACVPDRGPGSGQGGRPLPKASRMRVGKDSACPILSSPSSGAATRGLPHRRTAVGAGRGRPRTRSAGTPMAIDKGNEGGGAEGGVPPDQRRSDHPRTSIEEERHACRIEFQAGTDRCLLWTTKRELRNALLQEFGGRRHSQG